MESGRHKGVTAQHMRTRSSSHRSQAASVEDALSIESDKDPGNFTSGLRVPVNEDFLFDVNIERRELAPVYWLGPIYEVRRGTWFVSLSSYSAHSTVYSPCLHLAVLDVPSSSIKLTNTQDDSCNEND